MGQHVGLNQDGTFDMQNLPSNWKSMFKQAGIKKRDLQNPETAGAIMKVIQEQEMKEQMKDMIAEEYGDEYDEDQIDSAIDNNEEYEQYQDELRAYYEELAAYEAEQTALAAWEEENR